MARYRNLSVTDNRNKKTKPTTALTRRNKVYTMKRLTKSALITLTHNLPSGDYDYRVFDLFNSEHQSAITITVLTRCFVRGSYPRYACYLTTLVYNRRFRRWIVGCHHETGVELSARLPALSIRIQFELHCSYYLGFGVAETFLTEYSRSITEIRAKDTKQLGGVSPHTQSA